MQFCMATPFFMGSVKVSSMARSESAKLWSGWSMLAGSTLGLLRGSVNTARYRPALSPK